MTDATAVYLPTLGDLDEGWLPAPLIDALAQPQSGTTTRRAASSLLREHYALNALDAPQCKSWLLRPLAAQRALAIDLGVLANVAAIRRAVDGASVAALIDALGDNGYRAALGRSPLHVHGLAPSALADAVADAAVTEYFGAVGMALLALDIAGDDAYLRLRMRFSFPPAWSERQPAGLTVDSTSLAAAVASTGHD